MPSFSSTPASSTETGVEAWVWASGSQLWKGNRGTLMPKPISRAPSSSSWLPMASRSPVIGVRLKSAVPVNRASPRKAPRINMPETAVKIRNLVAA